MMDKFMDRLLESAANACMPKIEQMADKRRQELMDMKSKIRSEPASVEEWFDQELQKLERMDPKELIGRIA